MRLLFAVMLPLLIFSIVTGDTDVIGVDLSTEVSVEEFKCLISNYSVDVMITTAWNNGVYDNVSVINLNNAYTAGIEKHHADVYMLACIGMNATKQMETLLDSLRENGAEYDIVWLWVIKNSNASCDWSQFNGEENCATIMEMGNYARSRGRIMGIYSSHYEWRSIVGHDKNASACPEASKFPLWYSVDDHTQNYDDWIINEFGAWTIPAIKQYWTGLHYCNVPINLDFVKFLP